ncbi:hypothetical protein [Spongiactinospora rosea]|nr:hypothetical protein [Spongiactinospora rosea]
MTDHTTALTKKTTTPDTRNHDMDPLRNLTLIALGRSGEVTRG